MRERMIIVKVSIVITVILIMLLLQRFISFEGIATGLLAYLVAENFYLIKERK